jgi:hypothetical protein
MEVRKFVKNKCDCNLELLYSSEVKGMHYSPA